MKWEKELDRELRRLKKVFWKMITNSKEFKVFKKKLKELNLDADIFLAIFVFGKHKATLSTTKPKRIRGQNKGAKFKLTKEDREFLKAHGIRWD